MAWDSESKADVIFRGRHNGIRRELPQCAGKKGMLKDLHKDARYLVDTYFFLNIVADALCSFKNLPQYQKKVSYFYACQKILEVKYLGEDQKVSRLRTQDFNNWEEGKE